MPKHIPEAMRSQTAGKGERAEARGGWRGQEIKAENGHRNPGKLQSRAAAVDVTTLRIQVTDLR